MKIHTLAALALLSLGFQAAQADTIRPLNSIAAEVNSSVITYTDIDRVVKKLRSNPDNKNISDRQLIAAAKQQLIERHLITEAARRKGLRAQASAVDQELEQRARTGGKTVAQLYAQASAEGYSRLAFRSEIAKDMLIEHIMSSLTDNIQISEQDINAAITHAQATGQPLPQGQPYPVYTIRRIILNADNQANVSAVGNRMEQIYQALKNGSDFITIAKRYSQEIQAAEGGLHHVSDYMLPEKAEKLLHTMKPGEMSPPINTGNAWQIIALESIRTENNPEAIQREAVRRQLLRRQQRQNQEQFIAQIQQSSIVREY